MVTRQILPSETRLIVSVNISFFLFLKLYCKTAYLLSNSHVSVILLDIILNSVFRHSVLFYGHECFT